MSRPWVRGLIGVTSLSAIAILVLVASRPVSKPAEPSTVAVRLPSQAPGESPVQEGQRVSPAPERSSRPPEVSMVAKRTDAKEKPRIDAPGKPSVDSVVPAPSGSQSRPSAVLSSKKKVDPVLVFPEVAIPAFPDAAFYEVEVKYGASFKPAGGMTAGESSTPARLKLNTRHARSSKLTYRIVVVKKDGTRITGLPENLTVR